jgi:hypothetical protein
VETAMMGRSESFTKGQQHAHGWCIEDIGEFVSRYRSIIITTVTSHIANPAKSVCMLFTPKRRNLIVTGQFPPLQLGDEALHFVSTFKYLGHKIANDITDDSDIQREISNLFVRTNILIRRFRKCSQIWKLKLH